LFYAVKYGIQKRLGLNTRNVTLADPEIRINNRSAWIGVNAILISTPLPRGDSELTVLAEPFLTAYQKLETIILVPVDLRRSTC
jgi:hypothetical protein